jgi:serine/threonine-protein kinase
VVLDGKYRLLEELGRGGMGTVLRAHDESLDRNVAVKFLLPELQADERLGERFRREAKAMASVRHENVLQIFFFGSHGASPYFVMEYVEGVTAWTLLENARERRAFLKLDRVLSILEQVASGLAAVHRAGVVHRDVKPANIMVEAATGRVVIMDFGIGKRYQKGDSQRTQAPAGSPAYMAPEIVGGQQIASDKDYLSDIYALGVTAFELATGTLPFDSESWVDILVKHVTHPPPLPSSRRSDLPPELDAIILRCLAKSPGDRFASCDELLDALLRVRRGRSAPHALTPVPRESAPPRLPSVPVGPRRPSPAPRQAGPAKGPRESFRLIVADQDPAFTTMLLAQVEERFSPSQLLATKTNAKALALALEAPPRLMVARLDDPELNGLELAASLRGYPELEDMLLVLTCDRVTAGERRVLAQLGAYEVMLKPIEPDEVGKLLRGVARRVEPRRAAREGSLRSQEPRAS